MGPSLDLLQQATETPAVRQAVVAVLSAWLMSQSIATVYAWQRRGKPTRPSFVTALVVGGIVGSMLMLAIGNSLARGIGIVGALAFIRFRTNLSDPLDMVFIFASFAAGIAAGTGNVVTGAVGTVVFLSVISGLRLFQAGSPAREASLRVRVAVDPLVTAAPTPPPQTAAPPAAAPAKAPAPLVGDVEAKLRSALEVHCGAFTLIKRRDVPGKEARTWWTVVLKDDDERALADALRAVPGVLDVMLDLEDRREDGDD